MLKPFSERAQQKTHPSQILDAAFQSNYYEYPWMQKAEATSAMNFAAFGALAALILVCAYLLAGTKLLKFIQFFLTQKHYKRLQMNVRQADPEEEAPLG